MADINETLKKIEYNNLEEFLEGINRNFALIENSPLYKGIPGKEGEQGLTGLSGTRGSRFFFVDVQTFNDNFDDNIESGSIITIEWLNSKLSNFADKNNLLKSLGTEELVDTDIIVLTNSMMVQYVLVEDIFKDTGLAFNEQSNLVSSIETKIEELIKYYINNNPIINSLQNIFEHYVTYAKTYTSTNNAYLTKAQTKSSVYIPYISGISDTQGIKLENHKYYGFANNEFPESNNGTIIFGSIANYTKMIQQTVSLVESNTYTSDYAPGENNIPTAVFMQDTDNAGIMIGRRKQTNLRRFGMIYKDADNNLIIKSDMGNLLTDYSSILLNKNFLKYEKPVYFNDNLNVIKDFVHTGNTKNPFYRTGEFIWNASSYGPTSLDNGSESDLEIASKKREKIMEVGYFLDGLNPGKGAEYRNLNEEIYLPYFVSNVLVTDSDGKTLKSYFVEKKSISVQDAAISADNLNDLIWSGTSPSDHAVVTSNYIESLIKKINAIQLYTKNNYWRKNQWSPGNVTNAIIPSLSLTTDLNVGGTVKFGQYNNEYFKWNSGSLDVGQNSASGQVRIPANDVIFSRYSEDIVLTLGDGGSLLKTYSRETTSLSDKTISNISSDKTFNTSFRYITSNYFQWLVEQTNNLSNNLAANYWRKNQWSPSDAAVIPALWLINDLKSRYVLSQGIQTSETTTNLNSNNVIVGTTVLNGTTTMNSKTIKFVQQSANSFLSLDSNKNVITEFQKETIALPNLNDIDSVTLNITNPNFHILTSKHLLWLIDWINGIIGGTDENNKGLLDLYWKKADYVGYKIPDLELSGFLNVKGDVSFGPVANKFISTSIANKTIELGQEGDGTKLSLDSDEISFKDDDFNGKVIVTNTSGVIRKDVTVSTNTSNTVGNDNRVPLNTDDSTNMVSAQAPGNRDTTENKIISGVQFNWLYGFMDNVKKRFRNTFNRKETIDQMYDHMPAGSIILWTSQSCKLAGIADNTIPKGWAICDGSVIKYKDDGSELTLPNFVDRFILGDKTFLHTQTGDFAGQSGGSTRYKLTEAELPPLTHAHITEKDGSHSHKFDNVTENLKNVSLANIRQKGMYPSGPLNNSHKFPQVGLFAGVYSMMRDEYIRGKRSGGRDEHAISVEGAVAVNSYDFIKLIFDNIKFSEAGDSTSTHSHKIHEAYMGAESIAKQLYYNVTPPYYKAIYIMKLDARKDFNSYFNDKYILVP